MNFLDIFFPKFCLGCQRVGIYLCSECIQNLTQKELICPQCKRPSLGGKTHPLCQSPTSLDGLWSLGAYQGSLKEAIQKLKYRWVSDLAEPMVDILIEYWAHHQPMLLDQLKADRGIGWRIVPVPLHPRRQKWRGFNQAGLLAELLSKRMGVPYKNLLKRIRYTSPQVTFRAQQRRSNLQGAFEVVEQVSEKIILVDDVWTTGSTLKECGKMLKKRGAQVVWAMTLAR